MSAALAVGVASAVSAALAVGVASAVFARRPAECRLAVACQPLRVAGVLCFVYNFRQQRKKFTKFLVEVQVLQDSSDLPLVVQQGLLRQDAARPEEGGPASFGF